jgi:hypothetical protein
VLGIGSEEEGWGSYGEASFQRGALLPQETPCFRLEALKHEKEAYGPALDMKRKGNSFGECCK